MKKIINPALGILTGIVNILIGSCGGIVAVEALKLRGNPVSDGLEMLLQQGMESFRIWTGLDAPEEEMRSALHA